MKQRIAAWSWCVVSMLATVPARADAPPDDPPATSAVAEASRWSVSLGYFGEFGLHAGGVAEAAVRLAQAGSVRRRSELLVAGQLGAYVHVRNHVGVFLGPLIGYRIRFRQKLELDAFAGVGYLHTFLAAPVYGLDANGKIHRVTDYGRPAVMPSFALGVGWRARMFSPFLRIAAFGQYPFARHMLPHLAIVLGASFPPVLRGDAPARRSS